MSALASTTSTSLGEALSAAAAKVPPMQPRNLALGVLTVDIILAVLASIVVFARVYVRAWLGRKSGVWGWDDIFVVLGYLVFLSSTIFSALSSFYGVGTLDKDMSVLTMIRAGEYVYYSQILYAASGPLIKAAVMMQLLRFTQNWAYRWTLIGMQFTATGMAIAAIVSVLTLCHPIAANWNPPLGTCNNYEPTLIVVYCWTAIVIVTDWICAILPYFIIRTLKLSPRARRTMIVILGLGGVASLATVARTPILVHINNSTADLLYFEGALSICCQVEGGIGLIATCLPALRVLFRTYYGTADDSRHRNSKGSKNISRNASKNASKHISDTASSNYSWAASAPRNSVLGHEIIISSGNSPIKHVFTDSWRQMEGQEPSIARTSRDATSFELRQMEQAVYRDVRYE